ncbi:MAG TPA: potassium channel protein [Synergistaceae bacterium]|nr:potassium channel protein [Synergistaceae bacterium]HPQ36392.1 potassium channel protein [Synergistaceae bacterium]
MASKQNLEGRLTPTFLITLLLGVLITGILGYHFLAGLSLVDSLFYTVTTLTTVGYEAPPNLTPLLKLFSVGIMISGIGTMGYAVAHLSQRIIISRMLIAMGKRRNKAVDKLSGHWIICGFGTMGVRIAQELARKNTPFAIIETDEERCRSAGDEGFLVIPGDARDEKVLLSAGIAVAKGIMIALDDDADNVYVILTARHLAQNIRVLARANSPESMSILYRAGANKVFNPVNAGALAMATAALKPEVSDFLELLNLSSDMSLEFGSYKIEKGNRLIGKTLAEVPLLSRYNILVIGIRRQDGSLVPTPSGNVSLCEEDMLIVLGEEQKLHTAMGEVQRG